LRIECAGERAASSGFTNAGGIIARAVFIAPVLMSPSSFPADVDAVVAMLERHDYFADRRLATSVFLALRMRRPLFLEGEAGVGKTEIAKVLAAGLGRSLVRLQCYEGLDTASAVYEWNYPRQMIEIRLAEAGGHVDRDALSDNIFAERFLIRRPLLQALKPDDGIAPVLLIDELDRSDEPFEAYLLEVLAEYQVTIPELGAIKASEPPVVVITSNRTREIHDAIKRRCLYHWVDYPDASRELAIVKRKVPGADVRLSQQIVAFTQQLRGMDLFKSPGVAETLDWAESLVTLDRMALDPDTVANTLGALLKYQDDIGAITPEVATRLITQAKKNAVELGVG
jgi:MoxR-like ATPase